MNNHHVVYANGVHGTRTWEIWSEGNVIQIRANGSKFTEVINLGLAGRTLEQQVELRVTARVRNKLDHGFVYDKDKVSSLPVNQLGFYLPMLAERLDKQKRVDWTNMNGQPKLDGHRCLTNPNIMYSRRGKEINTIPEIHYSLDLPKEITVDGELYCHGQALQTIASWAKRKQPNTAKIEYWIYDCIVEGSPNMPYSERYKIIQDIVESCLNEKVKLTPTFPIADMEEALKMFKHCRKYKYEGLILRPDNQIYEIGKRSKKLLKVKHYEDDEFDVFDITLSKQGTPVLHMKAKNGLDFKATAPGNMMEKMHAYNNKEDYIGKQRVTCEYANLTLKGIPFQPVATRWYVEL